MSKEAVSLRNSSSGKDAPAKLANFVPPLKSFPRGWKLAGKYVPVFLIFLVITIGVLAAGTATGIGPSGREDVPGPPMTPIDRAGPPTGTGNDVEQLAVDTINRYLNQAGERALSEYGRARMRMRFDKRGKIDGEADLVYPFHNTDNSISFIQLGTRSMPENRWIGNLGLGHRYFFSETAAVGANAFLDYDFTRSHLRGSLGAEVWLDWLRMAGNYYIPLSAWKKSRDLKANEERPARGWDARATAYLPWHRQLALKGSYSRWYGDRVAATGSSSSLDKNPRVWSYGLEYTPVPLMSVYMNERNIQGGRKDREFGLTLNFDLSRPFSESLDPSNVARMRSMAGSRDDFVDRENRIFLEYREMDFTVSLSPSSYQVESGGLAIIPISLNTAAAVTSIDWEGTAAGYFIGGHAAEGRFRMPAYVPGGNNIYTARVAMRNEAGQEATSNQATIEVLPLALAYALRLEADKYTLTAGETVGLTATLSDNEGLVDGEDLEWKVTPPEAGVVISPMAFSNAKGIYKSTLQTARNSQGAVIVEAQLKKDPAVKADVGLNINPSGREDNYALELSYQPTNPKPGEAVTINAVLTLGGQPVSNEALTLSIVNGDGSIITGTATTDSNGKGELTFKAGNTDATLEVIAGSPDQLASKIVEVYVDTNGSGSPYDLIITTSPPNPKPGDTVTINAVLTKDGKPLSGETLTLSVVTGDGSILSGVVTTDGDGKATLTFQAGNNDATLKVTVGSPTELYSKTIDIDVDTSGSSPIYDLTLTSSPINPKPGDTVTISAALTKNGLLASGETLTLSLVSGDGSILTGTAATNSSGQATLIFRAGNNDATLKVAVGSPTKLYSENIDIDVDTSGTGSPYGLTLTSSPASPKPGDTVTVSATLTKNGQPANGEPLALSIVTGDGSILTGTATTNSSGQATLTFQAGNTDATLKVAVGSPTELYSKTIDIDVDTSGIGSTYDLTLTSSPPDPRPGETVTINAALTKNGLLASDETLTLSLVSGDGSIISGTATTNSGGQATLIFRAGNNDATLKVAVGSPTQLYSENIDIDVDTSGSGASYGLVLTSSPAIPKPGDTVTVSATLTNNGAPASGEPLTLSIVTGDGSIISGTATTNSSGQATLTFQAGNTDATLKVAVGSPTELYSKTIDIDVDTSGIGSTYDLILSSSPPDPKPGDTVTISATLTKDGLPANGETLTLSLVTGDGSILSGTAATNSGGQASLTFRAGNNDATLKVAVGSPTELYSENIDIDVDTSGAALPYDLTLTSSPANPKPGDTVTISATLTNNGAPASGEPLTLSIVTGDGSIISGTATTNSNGQATLTFQAGNTDATLKVAVGSPTEIYSKTIDIDVDTSGMGSTYDLTLTSSPANPRPGDTVTISAALTKDGLLASGETLTLSLVSGDGSIISGTATTDSNGEATLTFRAGNNDATLKIAVGSPTQIYSENIDINVDTSGTGSTYDLTLTSSPASPKPGDTVTISATLTNNGTPASGEPLTLAIVSGDGSILNGTVTTDSDGKATLTFQAGNTDATLKVTVGSPTELYSKTIDIDVDTSGIGSTYDLTLTSSPLSPKPGDTVTISAALTKDGLLANGETLTLSLVSGDGSIISGTATTNSSGEATLTFRAGNNDATLKVAVGSPTQLYSENIDIDVDTSGSALPYDLTLTSSPANPKPGDTVTISATLTNNGQPASGEPLTLSIVTGEGTILTGTATTNSSGQATLTFQAGNTDATLKVTVGSPTELYSKTIDIDVDNSGTGSTYDLTLTSSPLNPKPGDTVTISAALTKDGLPAGSEPLALSIVAGDGSILTGTATTNTSGEATLTFQAGNTDATLKVAVGSPTELYSKTIDIDVDTSGVGSTYDLTLSSSPPSPKPGDTVTISAALTKGGLPASGETLTLSLVSGDGSIISGTAATDSSGQAILTFKAGNNDATLKVAVGSPTELYSENIDIDVDTSGTDLPYGLTLTSSPANPKPGDTVTISATLTNNGAPASGEPLTLSIVTGDGSILTGTATTDSSGQATLTFQAGNTDATLKVTVGSPDELYSKTIDIDVDTSGIGSTYDLTLTSSPPSPKPGDTVTISAALAKDGLPASGETLTLSLVTGDGTILTGTATTDANGEASLTFNAGNNNATLKVAVGSPTELYSENIDITVDTSGTGSPYDLTLTSSPANPKPGDTVTISAALTNNGQPANGEPLTLSIVTGDGTILTGTATTDSSGQATLTFQAGSTDATLKVAVGSPTGLYSENIDIDVDTSPSYDLTLTSSPASPKTGDTVTISATLTNNGQPANGEPLTLSIVSGDGAILTGTATTDSSGEATLTFQAGSTDATLKVAVGSPGLYSENITINVAAPVYSLTLAANPASALPGGTVNITVTLTKDGQALSGETLTLSITSGDGSILTGSAVTGASGTATLSFKAGTRDATLEVTAGSPTELARESVTITVTQSYNITLTADSTTPLAGGTVNLTAAVRNGSLLAAGVPITWSVTPAGQGSVTGGGSNAAGQALATYTTGVSGTVTIRAAMTDSPDIYQTIELTVQPNYSLAIEAASLRVVNGQSLQLTAHLRDGLTDVENGPISWSISGTANGTLQPASGDTSGGLASTIFTPSQSGELLVKATFGNQPSLVAQAVITVVPDYKLTLSADSYSITNGNTINLTALVEDGATPLPSQTVNWSVLASSTGEGYFSFNSSDTGAAGEAAAATFTATRGGTVTIQATLASGEAASNPIDITITPDYRIILTADPATPAINEPVTIQALVKDGANLLDGQAISWSFDLGAFSFEDGLSTTTAAGYTSNSFIPNASGQVIVRVTIDGASPAASETITVDVDSAYNMTVSATNYNIKTGDTISITALLENGGLPANNTNINWVIKPGTSGQGLLNPTSGATDATGQATTSFTAQKAGTVVIHAELAGNQTIYGDVTIHIDPNYTMTITEVPAGLKTGDKGYVTAVLKDGANPVSNAGLTWTVSGSASSDLGASASSTNSAGEARISYTPSQSGEITIRAALTADSGNVFADTTFTVSPSYSLTLAAVPSTVKNGASAALNAVLLDGGNPVNAAGIVWSVSTDDQGAGTLIDANTTTAADGATQNPFTASASGTVKIRAALGGNSLVFAETTVVIEPSYVIELDPSSIIMSNLGFVDLTARLRDGTQYLDGQEINWSVESGDAGGSFSPASGLTSGGGYLAARFTADRSGTLVIKASLSARPDIYVKAAVIVTPDYSLTLSPPSAGIANGGSASFTVLVRDGNNALPSQAVIWSILPSSTGAGYFANSDSSTDPTGQAANTFIATKGGTVTIEAALATGGTVSNTAEINIDPTYNIILTASQTNPDAGETISLQAVVTDGATPAAGREITWSVEQGNGQFPDGQSVTTSADGRASLNFTPNATGGNQVIVRGTLANTTPAVYKDITLSVDNAFKLTIEPDSQSLTTGGRIQVKATLKNGGVPVSGAEIAWTIDSGSSGQAQISPSSGTTDASGETIMQLSAQKAGAIVLHATVTGQTDVSADTAITINPLYSLAFTSVPTALQTGQKDYLTVSLTDGTFPVQNADISWTVVSGANSSDLGAAVSSTSGSGQARVSFTPSRSGAVTIRATLASSPGVYADTTFNVAPDYSIALTTDSSSLGTGQSFNLSAVLKDGNTVIPSQQIYWSLVQGTGKGTFAQNTTLTNASGLASGRFTSSLAGTVTLRASMVNDPNVYADITVSIVPSYQLKLEKPALITIAIGSTLDLEAVLTDNGLPVPGAYIDWDIAGIGLSLGSFQPTTSITNANGRAQTKFYGIGVGVLWARATLRGNSGVSDSVYLSIVLKL
ncbi:hypothetical protein C4J81_13320 [Deltaproteobacteria bacterium Smac51]|nr:hypothetical protein C4J81_13320 [Deltaproteobacteria bacterium Smac51]